MIGIHTLLTLFLLSCGARAQNPSASSFFNEVDLNVIPPSSDTYSHMFQANFTASVFGVPLATGGGQKDLSQLGKLFLKRFNSFQSQTQQVTAKSASVRAAQITPTAAPLSSQQSKSPNLMIYDTEVTGQYVDSTSGTAGQIIGYNVLSIKAYFVCVKNGCPVDKNAIPTDDASTIGASGRRDLQSTTGGTTAGTATAQSQIAEDLKAKLILSGQSYFKDVKCVRISTATTAYVDQSSGCDGYPVVKNNA